MSRMSTVAHAATETYTANHIFTSVYYTIMVHTSFNAHKLETPTGVLTCQSSAQQSNIMYSSLYVLLSFDQEKCLASTGFAIMIGKFFMSMHGNKHLNKAY